jgi:hypothetical protein
VKRDDIEREAGRDHGDPGEKTKRTKGDDDGDREAA